MSGGQFILLHAKTASTIWLRMEFVMGNGYFTVIHCFILPFIYNSMVFVAMFSQKALSCSTNRMVGLYSSSRFSICIRERTSI